MGTLARRNSSMRALVSQAGCVRGESPSRYALSFHPAFRGGHCATSGPHAGRPYRCRGGFQTRPFSPHALGRTWDRRAPARPRSEYLALSLISSFHPAFRCGACPPSGPHAGRPHPLGPPSPSSAYSPPARACGPHLRRGGSRTAQFSSPPQLHHSPLIHGNEFKKYLTIINICVNIFDISLKILKGECCVSCTDKMPGLRG